MPSVLLVCFLVCFSLVLWSVSILADDGNSAIDGSEGGRQRLAFKAKARAKPRGSVATVGNDGRNGQIPAIMPQAKARAKLRASQRTSATTSNGNGANNQLLSPSRDVAASTSARATDTRTIQRSKVGARRPPKVVARAKTNVTSTPIIPKTVTTTWSVYQTIVSDRSPKNPVDIPCPGKDHDFI